MDCRTFLERLDDLLEGRLSPGDRPAVETHLRACPECRGLESLSSGAGAPVEPPPDLLAAVLARTSGPACAGARLRLCDRIDGLLGPVDDEIVRMHVGGCEECGRMAAVLARLAIDLPSLAEREPDARFVAAVLARTSRRAAPAAEWRARFEAVWRRLAHRPRIAWEGAYAASILVLLLFGAPNAPFAGVPGKALVLVRSARASLPTGAAVAEAPRIRSEVVSRWTEAKGRLQDGAQSLTTGMKSRASTAWTRLKKEIGTAWERVASQKTTNDTNKGERR